MSRDDENIRKIYIRALARLLQVVISIKNNPDSEINEFNRKDLEKYESDIRLLKAQYEEGLHPANTVLLCNALKYYKGYLERSKTVLSEKLGVALPNLAHTNDELAFVEDEMNKVFV